MTVGGGLALVFCGVSLVFMAIKRRAIIQGSVSSIEARTQIKNPTNGTFLRRLKQKLSE